MHHHAKGASGGNTGPSQNLLADDCSGAGSKTLLPRKQRANSGTAGRSSKISRSPPTLPIDAIRVGERHRKDLGDIDGLAANIAELGLLHPIVIRPDGTLIVGERRLRAAQALGWSEIPVTVVDLDSVVRGEYAENSFRQNFTLSEAVAIKRALEPLEKAAARQRQAQAGPATGRGAKATSGAKLAQAVKGKTRDKLTAFTGIKRTTLAKAEAIVDAAEAEPEKFGKLLEDMDRRNRADGPFKRLRVIRQAEQIRAEPPPLPNHGPYRVATCDVPWPSEVDDPDPAQRGYWPFPTMSIAELCALPVGSIMHPDSILWFWTTNFHMRHAFTVLDAWGFHDTPTILTWGKSHFGMGVWLRGQTEHCIVAVRGKPVVTLINQTTLLHAPVRGHSEKPREFYELVESLCPAPRYAELFSRRRYGEKWDCHGDQAPPPDPLAIPDFLLRTPPGGAT
jgi:N6-adenosine-specific RNA methylase IME4